MLTTCVLIQDKNAIVQNYLFDVPFYLTLKALAMSLEEMRALARRKYEDYKQSDIEKALAIFPAFTDLKVTVESQVAPELLSF
jgi:hypothetical protein